MSNYTIQDIFTMYGPSYIKTHKLSNEQWKVYNQIRKCKKEEAGFHTITCKDCGKTITGKKKQDFILLLAKNVVKPLLVLIVVEIDIVLCVNLMLEKSG